jgi:hypothetical protein
VPVPDIAALTDRDGRFDLHAPAPGLYRVGSAGDEGAIATADVTLEGDRVEVTLRLG